MGRALHIGGKSLTRLFIGQADQGLRGQVKHHFGLGLGHNAIDQRRIANVPFDMGNQTAEADLPKQAWLFGRQGETRNFGAKFGEPQRQPCPLEPGMPGQEYPAAGPICLAYQHFQGAPSVHNSSR